MEGDRQYRVAFRQVPWNWRFFKRTKVKQGRCTCRLPPSTAGFGIVHAKNVENRVVRHVKMQTFQDDTTDGEEVLHEVTRRSLSCERAFSSKVGIRRSEVSKKCGVCSAPSTSVGASRRILPDADGYVKGERVRIHLLMVSMSWISMLVHRALVTVVLSVGQRKGA